MSKIDEEVVEMVEEGAATGPMTIRDVVEKLRPKTSERETRAAVQHLVQTGALTLDLDLRLTRPA